MSGLAIARRGDLVSIAASSAAGPGTRARYGRRAGSDGEVGVSRVFEHRSVMVQEVVDLMRPVPSGIVVDATLGAGGHSAALLDAHAHLRVLGIDRDPDALRAARSRLAPFGLRASVVKGRFDSLGDLAVSAGIPPGACSGVLLDLGVSSPQLDTAARGFSYRYDAPLDMRMDPGSGGPTAADLVNSMPEGDLVRLFAANGEGRFARRLARAVVAARPLLTTGDLTNAVRSGLPAAVRRQGGHPSRRVFQALRIAVNEELEQLSRVLPEAISITGPGGRIVVISYHSGEDRIVKAAFGSAVTGGCTCPPGLPCGCGAEPAGRLVFRGARRPSSEEIELNPRAESARLRALEILPAASRSEER